MPPAASLPKSSAEKAHQFCLKLPVGRGEEPLLQNQDFILRCDPAEHSRNQPWPQTSGFLSDRGELYFPTRRPESEPITPKTLNSHMITTITTTTFRMLLILGIHRYEVVNQIKDHSNDNQNDNQIDQRHIILLSCPKSTDRLILTETRASRVQTLLLMLLPVSMPSLLSNATK